MLGCPDGVDADREAGVQRLPVLVWKHLIGALDAFPILPSGECVVPQDGGLPSRYEPGQEPEDVEREGVEDRGEPALEHQVELVAAERGVALDVGLEASFGIEQLVVDPRRCRLAPRRVVGVELLEQVPGEGVRPARDCRDEVDLFEPPALVERLEHPHRERRRPISPAGQRDAECGRRLRSPKAERALRFEERRRRVGRLRPLGRGRALLLPLGRPTGRKTRYGRRSWRRLTNLSWIPGIAASRSSPSTRGCVWRRRLRAISR